MSIYQPHFPAYFIVDEEGEKNIYWQDGSFCFVKDTDIAYLLKDRVFIPFGSPHRYVYFVIPEDTLTTGIDKVGRVAIDFASRITEVRADISTAPTGASVVCDVNINGTSIWNTTQANRVTIAASAYSGTSTTFDTSTITKNQYLTLDVDTIGSTVAGTKLVVRVKIERT